VVTFGLSLLNIPGIVMSVIIGAMLIVVISLPIMVIILLNVDFGKSVSPHPALLPWGEGQGEGEINIVKENYHEFYVGIT
jgi:hypothetical protein